MAKLISVLISRPSGVVIASVTGIAMGITSTITAVFSLFLVPIATEFDVPRSSVSVVLILIALANALVYPVLGRLGDRYSARRIILLGLVLFAIAIATASGVQDLWQLYISYALIGVAGSALGPILFARIISGWFDKNRGLFLGVMGGVGNGVGSAFMPVFVFLLVSEYGWRTAYQGIALLVVSIGFPVLFFLLRDPPASKNTVSRCEADTQPGFTFHQARATSAFWLVLISISLCAGCLLAVFTHVIPMLTDRGIAMQHATAVLTAFAMVTVVAQVAVGALLDKIATPHLVAVFFVIAVIGLSLFVSSVNFSWLMIAGALMGLGLGAEFGLLPYCISRYFGLKDYGAITGFMYSAVALSTGFMPVLMDVVFDLSGNYDIAVIAIAMGMLAGAVIISRLPPFNALAESRSSAAKHKSQGTSVQE